MVQTWLTLEGELKSDFYQLSGDFPLNHNKQKCKMFPNNDHENYQVPTTWPFQRDGEMWSHGQNVPGPTWSIFGRVWVLWAKWSARPLVSLDHRLVMFTESMAASLGSATGETREIPQSGGIPREGSGVSMTLEKWLVNTQLRRLSNAVQFFRDCADCFVSRNLGLFLCSMDLKQCCD